MSQNNIDISYTVTAITAVPIMERIFAAGRVPYLHSSPGIGKSSIIRELAKAFGLFLIDIRLGQVDPTDLNGFAAIVNGVATYIPFDSFPVQETKIPDGYNGWMIFLDEFTSAPRSVQAASYKLVLDKMVGNKKLHEAVYMCAAGNLATDNAIVNPISTASQSRMVHLKLVADYDAWLRNVGLKYNYDQRIVAFLSNYPDMLMKFDPRHKDFTYPAPRTWEFIEDMIHVPSYDDAGNVIGKEPLPITEKDMPLLAGCVGTEAAVKFRNFVEVYKDLVDIKEVIANPLTCPLPETISGKWASLTRCVSNMRDGNQEPLMKYINRFELQFRILAVRMIMASVPNMENNASFQDMCIELADYLFN